MTFNSPQLFWLLVIPAVLAVVELWRRRAATQRLSHPKILRAEAGIHELELRPEGSPENNRSARPAFRWSLYLGLALLVFALARPQWGQLDEPVFDQAREIIVALDLSRSMLAPDVRPSRLERAKLLVTSLLERLAGERVGLVVFSGTAFLQSPLSSDYEILNEFLPSLNPDYLPEGGTNYHALIENALSAFGASSSADRFLIILSDGEATDDNWRPAAEELSAKGIRVIGLGVGTTQGAILPDGHGGYVKDDRGAVVMSKLEPSTLQALAATTHGVYADASSWIDLAQLVQSTVDAGRKGQFREERHSRLVERFQWPLAPAIALLLWTFIRAFPVHPRLREVKLRQPNKTSAVSAARPTGIEVASIGALFLALAVAGDSRAAVAENSAAEPLSQLVGQFAARDTLGAREYAELARTTITYGERQSSAQQPVVEGSIHDALAAVSAGEAADPKAADWPKLRENLERFLQKKDPPPQQQQKQDQQNQKDQKDQKDQQQKDSQPQKSDPSNSSSQNSPDQKQNSAKDNAEKKQDEKDSDQQQKPPPSKPESALGDMSKKPEDDQKKPPQNTASPETQKVGGTPEKSDQAPADPTMVVPLQRLQQVREQDSPVRLQQLMRGNQEQKPDPANKGKTW